MASYCSKCGKDIEEGTRYCPVCGHDTMSQESSYNSGGYNQNQNQGVMGGTLTIIMVLGIIWAIISFIVGILSLLGGGILAVLGDVTAAVGIVVGILSIIGGILALISCIYIYRLEKHKEACTFCLIGSIIALVTGGIIIGIIGIVFYFLLKKEGSRFRS